MIYMGIDPGKNGAIAIIDNDKVEILPYSNINIVTAGNYCNDHGGCACIIEKVHAMPGQGVSSMFSFGQNYGYITGVLNALNIYPLEVTPQKWKKYYGLHTDKQASIETAQNLFKGVNLYKTPRCKNKHDGMAEALLIANYGKNNT